MVNLLEKLDEKICYGLTAKNFAEKCVCKESHDSIFCCCHPNERSYNSCCFFSMQCIIVQKHKRRIRGGPMLQAINNLCLQDVRSTKPICTPGNLRIFCQYESFHVIFPAAPTKVVPTKMNRVTNKRYACVS